MSNLEKADSFISAAMDLPAERHTEAMKLVTKANLLAPNYPRGTCAVGVLLYRNGFLDGAISNFEKALLLDAEYIDALYNLAVAKFDRESYEKTLDLCEAAISAGDGKRAYFYRGRARLALERFNEAIADFSRILNKQPEDNNALFQRGVAYARIREFEKALRDLGKIQLKESFADLHLWKAIVLNSLSRYVEAIEEANATCKLDLNSAEGWFQRGVAEYSLDQLEFCNLSFEKTIAIDDRYGRKISKFLKKQNEKTKGTKLID
jgi:tetratricopeptide (TPR) repeat protein